MPALQTQKGELLTNTRHNPNDKADSALQPVLTCSYLNEIEALFVYIEPTKQSCFINL